MTLLPDLSELVALRGAAQGLDLHAHRPALAHLYGRHRSAQRGRGLEFEEVRPYAPGDDARTIDWRVTARRGRPHTKLFREERERPVWLLADIHPGLFFGSRRQLKSALLLRAAALLGWAATVGGDRLGAVIANGVDAPRIYAPRGRQAGVLPVLEALVEAQPRAPGVAEGSGLGAALNALRPLLHPGALVLVLSDFHALDESAESALAVCAARADCRLLWLTDALESSGLPAGRFRVGLPGRLRWLDGEHSRLPWQQAWAAREQRLVEVARRLNLPLTKLDTRDAVTDSLRPLLREPAWAA
ncbi:MAG: DUF58 domain-containing protein [Panacagrimonas sp.]